MAAHRREMIKYAKYEKYSHTKQFLNEHPNSIFIYNYNTSLRPVYENNNIHVFKHNAELYSECINLIRSAKKFIHIQMYMLHDGFFLRTMFAELIRKSREGVKIRFLYD
jgi:cardiolipin synthase